MERVTTGIYKTADFVLTEEAINDSQVFNEHQRHAVGSIVKDRQEIAYVNFNEFGVSILDYNAISLDFDCTYGEYKDTFVNVPMNVDNTELLVFRLQQVIKSAKENL